MLVATLNAQKREALLIGNYSYSEIENLNNPTSKLNELKRTLKEIGFHVTIQTNLDSIHLEEAIDKFVDRLSQNSDSVGFLYYTGHGCQLDYQGYLIPINVDTAKKVQIKYKALNINALLDKFSGAKNSVNMLFLDACRNVAIGAKGGIKGLAQPTNTPNGSLVVYATKAGQVANDNSYFINALIRNLKNFNQTVRDLGDNISLSVAQKSSQEQIPVVYSSLLPKLLLKSKKINIVDDSKVKIMNSSINKSHETACPSYLKKLGNIDVCGIIRLGSTQFFQNKLNMKKNYYYMRKPDIMFLPDTYYSKTKKFPSFRSTKWLKENKYIVEPNTVNKPFIISSGYKIKTKPSSGKRSYNNIIIKYKVNYRLYDNETKKKGEEVKSQLNVYHYAISWCGDGVIDTLYGEECEPLEKGKYKKGDYPCSNSCKIIK